MELRPYQAEAKTAIYHEWEDKRSTLLVLPTGCGKTVVFSAIAQERTKKGPVLILAHREELLTQAADKLQKLSGLSCSVEKADQSCLDSDELVTVGSVQTLMSEKRLSRFARDHFKTLIVDEAHHAMAESYRRIIDHFDGAKLLGVTATPDRGDMKDLSEVFESLAYEYSLRDAVKQGYLSPIRAQTMPLNIDLSAVKVSMGDFQAGDIGHALEPYLEDIAEEMAKVCMDKHTVVFLPLVSIAQEFRDILNRKGFRAEEVNGESKDRDQVLKRFEDGTYNVLCNAMLLTEGWDCPIVDCIVVLRPTKVRSLYCQMVGRGTRLYPGKDHLLILDFLWMTGRHDLVHPADIICKKRSVAEEITEHAGVTNDEYDIFDEEQLIIERDAKAERENSLAKMLKEAEKDRRKKRNIDPLDFGAIISDPSIIDYVPTFGWEMEPATEKQIDCLEKAGIDTKNMSKGYATKIIGRLIDRNGMATPKQIKCLTKYGFKNVQDWTKEEATKMVAQIAAADWQIWKCHVVPEFYQPQRLGGTRI